MHKDTMSCRYFENQMKATILFLFLLYSLSGNKADIEQGSSSNTRFEVDNHNSAVRRGKERLQDYESRDSPCWKAAVSELQSKCSDMTDIEKSILAMKFANCHFKKSGLTTYDCTEKANFQDCTSCMKAIDSSSFLVYTEFFTHVTDICFYLESKNSSLETIETITLLSQTASKTIIKLEEALTNQRNISTMQNTLLSTQKDIMDSLQTLEGILHNATASGKDALFDTQELIANISTTIGTLYESISRLVDKLKRLQKKFLWTIKIIKCIVPYFPIFIAFYGLCTMLGRSESRVWLFLLFLLFAVLEVLAIIPVSEERLLTGDAWRFETTTKMKIFGVCSLVVFIVGLVVAILRWFSENKIAHGMANDGN